MNEPCRENVTIQNVNYIWKWNEKIRIIKSYFKCWKLKHTWKNECIVNENITQMNATYKSHVQIKIHALLVKNVGNINKQNINTSLKKSKRKFSTWIMNFFVRADEAGDIGK